MRPDIDRYFCDMVELVASRSTCARRSVGCVLVSAKQHVLATGYNGAPRGYAHCAEPVVRRGVMQLPNACESVDAPSGIGLDSCMAVHAEQNAVLQCHDVALIERAYVTTFPCAACAKLLLNTGCREIIALEAYPADAGWKLWVKAGRIARLYDGEPHMLQADIVRLYAKESKEQLAWRVSVACACLSLASHRVARPVVMRLFRMYKTPKAMAAQDNRIETLLAPLGLTSKRAAAIRNISMARVLRKPLSQALGCGPYAQESVRAFVYRDITGEFIDAKVGAWVAWRRRNALRKVGK